MIALLARLKIAHKLLISSVLLAVPIVLLFYSDLSDYNQGIRSTGKEVEGARRLEPLRQLAEDIRLHQRLDYLRLRGDRRWENQENEAAKRIDDALSREAAPELAARWHVRRMRPPATLMESAATHQLLAAGVRDLVREVRDSSGLVLDSNLSSYYLMQLDVVLLTETQGNIEDAAMLAGQEAGEDTLGEPVSQRDLLQFAIYADSLENSALPQVRHAVETSLREDRNLKGASGSLPQSLPGLFGRYQTAMAACVEQMRQYTRMPDSNMTAQQLAASADRAAQEGWEFQRASIAGLPMRQRLLRPSP